MRKIYLKVVHTFFIEDIDCM